MLAMFIFETFKMIEQLQEIIIVSEKTKNSEILPSMKYLELS